jgi:hypothetical protein
MSEPNTNSDAKQDFHQPPAGDVIVVEPYQITYDACSRGRGTGRGHTYTRYRVVKNGREMESGLTRRQAERHQRAIDKSHARVASTAAESPALAPAPLLHPPTERK